MSARVETATIEPIGSSTSPERNEFIDSLSGRNEFIDSLSGRNQFLDSLSGYRTDGVKVDAETIFVPSLDDEPAAVNATPVADAVFGDVEADDVFEQSLSGLKIDETAETEALDRPTAPQSETTPFPVIEPASTATVVEEHSQPFVTAPSVVSKRNWNGFRYAVVPLLVIGSFAAGAFATMYLFELPPNIPNLVDFPVMAASERSAAPPGMVFVPGGEFVMGSDDGDAYSRPSHSVEVAAFFIDQTEVTNEAYLAFVKATDHAPPSTWTNGKFPTGEERFPVTGVTWYDAAEFAAWSGKRLPTEMEWEFGARGGDGRTYPWGNEWDASSANVESVVKGPREVGLGERSPFGTFDMAGNVWEWTASDAKAFSGGKQIPWSRHRLKIIRGGNWQSDERTATTFFRGFYGASGEKDYKGTGFRCVKDIPKEK